MMFASFQDSIFQYLFLLAIALARILPMLFHIPLFGFRMLKGMVRHAIAFSMALIIIPALIDSEVYSIGDIDVFLLIFLILKEVLLGYVFGHIFSMPFWIFDAIGGLLDNQRGALSGQQLNPGAGVGGGGATGILLQQALIVFMIEIGASVWLYQLIFDSYIIWPVNQWYPEWNTIGSEVYLGILSKAFMDLILYTSPMIVVLLLIEFGFAVLSLFSPQLQVFFLAMPAKSLVGMFVLIIFADFIWMFADGEYSLFKELKFTLQDIFNKS